MISIRVDITVVHIKSPKSKISFFLLVLTVKCCFLQNILIYLVVCNSRLWALILYVKKISNQTGDHVIFTSNSIHFLITPLYTNSREISWSGLWAWGSYCTWVRKKTVDLKEKKNYQHVWLFPIWVNLSISPQLKNLIYLFKATSSLKFCSVFIIISLQYKKKCLFVYTYIRIAVSKIVQQTLTILTQCL